MLITSPQNQRVKDAARLRDRRGRDKQDRILIDGAREIDRALAAGIEVLEAFVCEPLCQALESQAALAGLRKTEAQIHDVTPAVFEKMAFGERAEGVLAVAQTPHRRLADLRLPAAPLVAVLEGVEKPGNVGAVLRSADGAGVSAVIVADPATDLFNPNTIRASLGAVFSAQVCAAESSDVARWLAEQGLAIYAARVDAERPYSAVDWRGGAAIVLGSEARGLSDAWRLPQVTGIRLPMCGAADSLNVSAAAAVIFYEAQRQRGV